MCFSIDLSTFNDGSSHDRIRRDRRDAKDYHTFLPGHRIMVQVQSTWFPLADLNPQRFEDINQAKAADFQKATERVYHTVQRPSQVKVLVLPAGGGR